MTMPPLEDRLTQLADGLIAPATPEAREAVGRRTRVLRRRRRARQAAGAGALVLAAVVGSIAVSRDTTPEATTDFAGEGALPTLDLDLEGWQVVAAENTAAGAAVAPNEGSVQVFQRAGDVEGPRIVLRHSSVSDAVVPVDGDEEVAVGSVRGYLRETGADSLTLTWAPPLGDNAAEIEADGLSRDEVLAFAAGLVSKDDSFQFPAAPDDRFGFVATALPQGLKEVPSPEATVEDAPARRLVAENATATVELTIEGTGDADYESTLGDLAQTGRVEELSVMGHPGVLVEHPGDLRWSVAWQPRPGTTARLVLSGVDRAGVDQVIGGVREISGDAWAALVRSQQIP